jgi:23S rRNA G2445 N2-methylase RlmL
MMGSGVFLLEAMLSGYVGPLRRNYGFQQWQRPIPSKPELPAGKAKFSKLMGVELDEDSFLAATDNLEKQHRWMLRSISRENLPQRQLLQQNFMDVEMRAEEMRQAWLVLNPPYDRRLEFNGFSGLEELLEKLKDKFLPELIGILWPAEKAKGRIRVTYDLVGRLRFKNGGIPIDFLVFKRPTSLS